jgi:HicB family
MSGTLSAQPSPSAVEEAGRVRPTAPSGRLLLRMPPELHAELARVAERQGTSLNGFIIASLTTSVGWSTDQAKDPAAPRGRDGRLLTWLLVANVVAVTLAGLAAVVILLIAAL